MQAEEFIAVFTALAKIVVTAFAVSVVVAIVFAPLDLDVALEIAVVQTLLL